MIALSRADADAKLAALGFVVVDDVTPVLDTPAVAAVAVDVPERLTASIAAHVAYRDALTRNDRTTARTQLQLASDARAAAATADPAFLDAAWAEHEGLYPHTALTLFYRQELAK